MRPTQSFCFQGKEHGEPFKGDKASTHGPPDASFQEGNLHVSCWNHLHFKEAPHLELTVIQVIRASASDTKRDPKISWFVFSGQEMPPLEKCQLSILVATALNTATR
jgi:hypothetical protein